MKIILASASPRRKKLLKNILDEFVVCSANIDESKYPLEDIARQKALKVGLSDENALIIAADTSVIIDGKILGKPKDKIDAYNMLSLLSNKTHEVVTYYTIYCKNENIDINKKVVSYVTFNELSEEKINKYIASNSPLDKAGAYGIQDKEFNLIKSLQGEEDNVIGLPLKELKEDLISLGVKTL